METLRAGVIGAGFIAVRGHIPGYRAAPGVEVVALCDVKEERARQVAQELGIPRAYGDYRQMLEKEKLDLVSICSPNAFHAQMTIDALEAGAHVLCEKPMALTFADAQAMVETSRRVGRTLTVGFHMRYGPVMQAAKSLITSGKLGEIYYAKANLWRRAGIPGYGSWFTNKDLAGGGAMMDIGCHMLDLSLWLLGYPQPRTVSAMCYAKFGPRAKGLGSWGADHFPPGARFDVDDLTTTFVRLGEDLTLIVEVSWAGHMPNAHQLQILGSEGGLLYNPMLFGEEQPMRFFGEVSGELVEEPLGFSDDGKTAYQREISDWVTAIREGREPLVKPEEAAMVVQIIEAAYRSAATQQEVSLG